MKISMTIDGKVCEAEQGETIIQVALRNGAYIPHFCYHPGLSIAGNCRICFAKVTGAGPRPAVLTACTTPVSEGMAVETEAAEVKQAREAVMEYLLINHPLDCPVCDCAGECDLQDFAYEYGRAKGRFREPKVVKHKKTLGPEVLLWGSRCIVCTRCVRFCDEITGTGELTVVDRADHAVIDVFPGVPLDNPMSACVVDLCPVGALISKDFLYQARVWTMKHTDSICPSCSRGCNMQVGTLGKEVKRLVPRYNPQVNDYWMCDEGRLNFKHLNSHERLQSFQVRDGQARPHPGLRILTEAASALKRLSHEAPGTIAGVASAQMTNEELYLFRKLLADELGAKRFWHLARPDGLPWKAKNGFTVEADRNPNRRGLAIFLGPQGASIESLVEAIGQGEVKGLYLVGGAPEDLVPQSLVAVLDKLSVVIVQDILKRPWHSKAHFVFPAAAFTEKEGTFVNFQGRVQRFSPALEAPGAALPDILIFQKLLGHLGDRSVLAHASAEELFRRIGEEYPAFSGMTYATLGDQGAPIKMSLRGAPRRSPPASAQAPAGPPEFPLRGDEGGKGVGGGDEAISH